MGYKIPSKSVTKDHPCPICGKPDYCLRYKDGPGGSLDGGKVCCMRSGGVDVSGWIRVGAVKDHGGQVYKPSGWRDPLQDADPAVRQAELRRRAAREREEAERRRQASRTARAVWARTQRPDNDPQGPELAAAYLRGRGIRLDDLPSSPSPLRLPRWIGGLAHCPDMVADGRDDLGRLRFKDVGGPALLAASINPAGEVHGLQRIFLSPKGGKRPSLMLRPDSKPIEAKRTLGSFSEHGGACRLGEWYERSWLVLCEGVETGLAILASGLRAVWSCISTSGLVGVLIPDDIRAQIAGVVIAGDHDQLNSKLGARPGEHFARSAAVRLRSLYPGLRVGVSIPGHEDLPDIIAADGSIADGHKGGDWLDVYNRPGGPAAVRRGIERGVNDAGAQDAKAPDPGSGNSGRGGKGTGPTDPEGEAGGWKPDWQHVKCRDGEYRRPLTYEDLELARLFLAEHFPGPSGTCLTLMSLQGGPQGHGFRRFNGTAWEDLPDQAIARDVRRWLTPCARPKVLVDGIEWIAFNPSGSKVNQVVNAIADECMVTTQADRFWLRPAIGSEGDIDWDRSPWEVVDQAPKIRPEDVLTFNDWQVSVPDLLEGKWNAWPSSPLLYNQTVFPYDLPVDRVKAAVTSGSLDELIEELAPTFIRYLDGLGWGPEEYELAQLFTGYCQRFDMSHKEANILVLHGPGDAGKGTFEEAFQLAIGPNNVVKTSPKQLPDEKHLAAFRHKLVAIISESEVAAFADASEAVRVLKTLTGGDTIATRDLYEKARPNDRLWTRFLISCNEMPDLRDRSGALLNRMRVLDFRKSYSGRIDPSIKEGIKREGLGLVLWGVSGMIKGSKLKKIPQPSSSESPLALYREYSFKLDEFVKQWLDIDDPTAFETSEEIHRAYCVCYGYGDPEPTKRPAVMKSILTPLRARGWAGDYSQPRDEGGRLSGWKGVKLSLHARARMSYAGSGGRGIEA